MVKILFVCLGNICRSPLAQGIFEDKINRANLGSYFFADSAGISGWHRGEKPDSGSIEIARKKNIHIENQRSRPVVEGDKHEFDYFIAMDGSNYESLIREFGIPASKLFKLRRFDSLDQNGNVPDPYGGGSNSFLQVFEIIDRSMDPFIEYLKEQQGL
ncbi:MAG: low molecular weight phosphotyrosine protein phosphatase [Spirochaetia bacterium]|nr:low molecular weight phosphotyrosine protein phosphatase [Spirochaetia bacterium]